MRQWFEITNKSDAMEVRIFDVIDRQWYDGDTAVSLQSFDEQFRAALATNPKEIRVRINSPGGSVAEGIGIYNTIAAHRDKVVTVIEGYAMSIASVIALAGKRVEMASNGVFMIHNPQTIAIGDAAAISKAAENLNTIKQTLVDTYTDKTGMSPEDVSAAMDDETWYTAAQAKAAGFIDDIIGKIKDVQNIDREAWACAVGLKPPAKLPDEPKETKSMATVAEIKAACPGASSDFILAQAEKDATIEDAIKSHRAELQKDLDTANKAAADAKAEAEVARAAQAAAEAKNAATPPVTGKHTTLPEGAPSRGESDPIAAFENRRNELIKSGMTRAQATTKTVAEDPERRAAYIEAYNEQHAEARR